MREYGSGEQGAIKILSSAFASQYEFDLSGGLCLDFVNTLNRRNVANREAEHLQSFGDLVAFLE